MNLQKQVQDIIEDLEEKKRLLENNFHSLEGINRKEMPLAIYSYTIEQLKGLKVFEK
jgi:hypothetical protein